MCNLKSKYAVVQKLFHGLVRWSEQPADQWLFAGALKHDISSETFQLPGELIVKNRAGACTGLHIIIVEMAAKPVEIVI